MSSGLIGPLDSYADLTHGLCKTVYSVYSHCFDSKKSLIPSLCRPSLLFLSLDFSGGCKIITPLLCEICSQVFFLCMKIIKLLKGIKRIIILIKKHASSSLLRKLTKIQNMMFHCSQLATAIRGEQWFDALN